MRAAIKCYISDRRNIDFMTNEVFNRANKVFDAILKDNKAKWKGNIKHKESISSEDIEKLNDYFSKYILPNPLILQQFMQFNLMFYLCRRGHENLTGMPKDTFEASENSTKVTISKFLNLFMDLVNNKN